MTFVIGGNVDAPKTCTEHTRNHRISAYNSGNTRYSSKKRPWLLVYAENFDNKHDALIRERFLKKQKNRQFYLKLIQNQKSKQ